MKSDVPAGKETTRPGAFKIACALLATSRLSPLSTAAKLALSSLAGLTTIAALAFFMGFIKGTSNPVVNDRAIVLHRDAFDEIGSVLPSDLSREIGYLDDLARSTMWTLSSPEKVFIAALETPPGAKPRSLTVRGVGPVASLIRDEFEIIEGRRFKPGVNEAIVGRSLRPTLPNHGAIGSTAVLNGTPWEIVGVFSTTDRLAENEVWISANAPGSGWPHENKVGSTRVRLAREDSFDSFATAAAELDSSLSAHRQSEHDARRLEQLFWGTRFIPRQIGAVLTTLAAFFGFALAHAARSPERSELLAAMRAQGVGNGKLLASQWVEAMTFAILGCVIGAVIAWLALDGSHVLLTPPDTGATIVIAASMTAAVFAAGLFHALALGFVGGIGATLRSYRDAAAPSRPRK
ncbi:MAG: FtsX-like permease family protein [Verrucomicrobiia bacterium]